jgi:hypothetical protein
MTISAAGGFTSADGHNVPPGWKIRVSLSGGAFSVALIPNQGSNPSGSYYLVVYGLSSSIGASSWSETWVVPSAGPVGLAAVRTLAPLPQAFLSPQVPNTVLAGPATGSSPGPASFRPLVSADLSGGGGGGDGGGGVSSVGLAMPSIFSVSGSPVTSSGTLTASLANQSAYSWFGVLTGSPAAPTFNTSPLPAALIPTPTGSTLGGIESIAQTTSNWIQYIDTSGVPHQSQPAFSDISGTLGFSRGGTGQTTAAAAFNALSPLSMEGDLQYYHSGSNARLGVGSNNQCLTSNGTDPVWGSCGAGSGTVNSVGLTMPSIFSVSGSPVTNSGTLTATLTAQTGNQVFASPNGSSGAPGFRAIVAADLPSSITSNTTGNASTATALAATPTGCGTNTFAQSIAANGNLTCTAALSANAGATHYWLSSVTAPGVFSTARPAAADLSDTATSGNYLRGNGTSFVSSAIQASDVPTLNQNTTGTAAALAATPTGCAGQTFAQSIAVNGNLTCAASLTANAGASHYWLSSVTAAGVFSTAQPTFADLASGTMPSGVTGTVGSGASLTPSGTGTIYANGAVFGSTAIPYSSTPPSSGQCWGYNGSQTLGVSCGGTSLSFSQLTTGTNTTANMSVGAGASLGAISTGTIVATSVSPTPGAAVAGLLASGQGTACPLLANTVAICAPTSVQSQGWNWTFPPTENSVAGLLKFASAVGDYSQMSVAPLATADFPASGVTAGNYTCAAITVDATGRVTSAATGGGCTGGSGTLTGVTASAPLSSSGGVGPNISIATYTGAGPGVVEQGGPNINGVNFNQFTGPATPGSCTLSDISGSGALAANTTYYVRCATYNLVGNSVSTSRQSITTANDGHVHEIQVTAGVVSGGNLVGYSFWADSAGNTPYMASCTGASTPISQCTSANVFIYDGTITASNVQAPSFDTTEGIGLGPLSGSLPPNSANPTNNDLWITRIGQGTFGFHSTANSFGGTNGTCFEFPTPVPGQTTVTVCGNWAGNFSFDHKINVTGDVSATTYVQSGVAAATLSSGNATATCNLSSGNTCKITPVSGTNITTVTISGLLANGGGYDFVVCQPSGTAATVNFSAAPFHGSWVVGSTVSECSAAHYSSPDGTNLYLTGYTNNQ